MKETSQRLVCRLGFLAFCVLPTVGVVAGALWIRQPGHPHRCARQLSAALGLGVRIERVVYPRPGVTRYEGVRIFEPETSAPIARLARLETSAAQHGVVANVSQAEFQAAALPRLRDAIVARLRGPTTMPGRIPTSVRVAAAEVRWVQGETSRTLDSVVGGLEFSAQGSQAYLGFRLGDTPDAQPAKMRIVRNRQTVPPTTGLELHTGETPLPCQLAAPLLDLTSWLGSDCHFRGSFWAHEMAGEWDTELTGRFSRVDLDELVTKHFPHALSGNAEVTVNVARLHGAKLVDAQAAIVAGPGRMSVSLLESLRGTLEMQHAKLSNNQVGELAYEHLALALSLNAHGVLIEGRAKGDRPGIVANDRQGPLLADPRRVQSVAGLVRALSPPSSQSVPVGPEANWLLRVLPTAASPATEPQISNKPGTKR